MDDDDDDAMEPIAKARLQPYQVEAQIDIPIYNGSINTKMLDAGLNQLDTYFTLRSSILNNTARTGWYVPIHQ